MAIRATAFAGQNWLITPAALAVNEPRPASITDQKWLVTLTGIVVVDLAGNKAKDWRRETLSIFPDINAPLQHAINRYAIPRPAGENIKPLLDLELWAPFAAMSSVLDRSVQTFDAGYAVDVWRPTHFFRTTAVGGKIAANVFTGIDVDVAVRNDSAVLHRVSYGMTLLGQIIFVQSI